MPTVAEQLRQAREAQQLSVHQVAEITKIKTEHIRALEAGDYDAFVAPVYIRGFVRTYARMLKLDEAQVGTDLDAELSRTERFSEPPPLTPETQGPLDLVMLKVSRLNWRIAVALAVLVVVIVAALIGFRHRDPKKEDPAKNLGPGLYQPPPAPSGETLPLPPAPARQP
jgi:cytoskeletal protein RodZ